MQAFGCHHQSWAKRRWLRLAFVLFVAGVMHGFNPEPLQAQTQTVAQVPPAPAPQSPLLPGLLPPTTSPPSPTPVPELPPLLSLLIPRQLRSQPRHASLLRKLRDSDRSTVALTYELRELVFNIL